MSFDFDSLTEQQKETLRMAGCVVYTGRHEFTADWQAWQARVALAVLPDGTEVRGQGRTYFIVAGTTEAYFYEGEEGEGDRGWHYGLPIADYAPYNIVVDEPKPEWTVDSLVQAIRDGRQFDAVKGATREPFFSMTNKVVLEMTLAYMLNPANGWQIEEIV